MRKNNKLANDVDVEDLAKKTRNFSGAELEGLVRSAQATAMNKLIKVRSIRLFPPYNDAVSWRLHLSGQRQSHSNS